MKFIVDQDDLLVPFLHRKIGCSISKIKKKIKYNEITIDGDLNTDHNPILKTGQIILINESISSKSKFTVLFEDEYLIAVEKPINLLTMGTGKYNEETLYKQVNEYIKLKSHNKLNAHIIHRLDREVSGVVLFAKTKKIQEAIIKEWKSFEKTYLGIVEGNVNKQNDTLVHWLKENKQFHVYASSEKEGGKKAVTSYNVIKKSSQFSLLEISIQTGRKNQIRAQLAIIKCPIIGDNKYGATSNHLNRLGLHAYSLLFDHPVLDEKITIESKPPWSFNKLMN